MNNSIERTLAYQAAYEIDKKELEEISGGEGGNYFTTKETANLYGGDVGADWIW